MDDKIKIDNEKETRTLRNLIELEKKEVERLNNEINNLIIFVNDSIEDLGKLESSLFKDGMLCSFLQMQRKVESIE